MNIMAQRRNNLPTVIELPDRVYIREPQRRVFWFKACLLYPHVGIGWENPDEAQSGGLRAHRHDEGIEISYFVRGQVAWRVDGEDYDVRRGDLFITRPGERHGGLNDVKEPCERYYLELIVPSDGKLLPGMTRRETRALAQSFAEMKSHVFRGNEAVPRLLERLISVHEASYSHVHRHLDKLDARTTLHRLLLEILRCSEEHTAAGAEGKLSRRISPEIGVALDWIHRNLAQTFDVATVADHSGLSISAFHRRFLQEIGMTPSEYRTRRRVEQARDLLLLHDRSITAIAHGLGFSTSQYFATVFRKYVGLTPREFRRTAGRRADNRGGNVQNSPPR